jgi:hypothetical protein
MNPELIQLNEPELAALVAAASETNPTKAGADFKGFFQIK